jgi:hypothetical protein
MYTGGYLAYWYVAVLHAAQSMHCAVKQLLVFVFVVVGSRVRGMRLFVVGLQPLMERRIGERSALVVASIREAKAHRVDDVRTLFDHGYLNA